MFVFLSLTCDLAIVNKALQTLKDVNECIFIRYVLRDVRATEKKFKYPYDKSSLRQTDP